MPIGEPQNPVQDQQSTALQNQQTPRLQGILRGRLVQTTSTSSNSKRQFSTSDVVARVKGTAVDKSQEKDRRIRFAEEGDTCKFNNTSEDALARKGAYDKKESKKQRKLEREIKRSRIEKGELTERERRTIVNMRLNELGFWKSEPANIKSSAREPSSTYMILNFGRKLVEKLDPRNVRKRERTGDPEKIWTENFWSDFVNARGKQRNERLHDLGVKLFNLKAETETLHTERKTRKVTNGQLLERIKELDKRTQETQRELNAMRKKINRDKSSFKQLQYEINGHRTFFKVSENRKHLADKAATKLEFGFLEMEKILDQAKESAKAANELIGSLENLQTSLHATLMPLKTKVKQIQSRKPTEPIFSALGLSLDAYFEKRTVFDEKKKEYTAKLKAYSTFLEKRQLDDTPSEDTDLHASEEPSAVKVPEVQSSDVSKTPTHLNSGQPNDRTPPPTAPVASQPVEDRRASVEHYLTDPADAHPVRSRSTLYSIFKLFDPVGFVLDMVVAKFSSRTAGVNRSGSATTFTFQRRSNF